MENLRFEKLTRKYDGIIQCIGKRKLYKERVRDDFTWGKKTQQIILIHFLARFLLDLSLDSQNVHVFSGYLFVCGLDRTTTYV